MKNRENSSDDYLEQSNKTKEPQKKLLNLIVFIF